jgi:glycosyltransferase involved in cell wall biosynthesis
MGKKLLYIVPGSFLFYSRMRGQIAFLKEKGFEIEVVCQPDARASEAAVLADVVLHPLLISPDLTPLRDLQVLRSLYELMRGPRFDGVYCCTKKGGLLGSLAARLSRTPAVIYVVHGLNARSTSNLKQRLFGFFEKAIGLLADQVVCMSQSNQMVLSARRNFPVEKMVLMGSGSDNGVDTSHFQMTEAVKQGAIIQRRLLGIPPDAPVLGFVGRLERNKGIRELGLAWSLLRDKHDELHMVILSPPEVDVTLASLLDVWHQDPRVHFLGFLKDPVAGYALMDCLVLPSYGEGLPNVILEASAMGLPVVASRVVGCVDAVVEGETGLLVDPNDPRALAQGIETFLKDDNAARRCGKNGRDRCVRLFSPELIWQGYADLYDKLIGPATGERDLAYKLGGTPDLNERQ